MKKLNKKGFTLVELLAVIVILALLMVVAASAIGNVQTNAKSSAMKTEARKIISKALEDVQAASLDNQYKFTYAPTIKAHALEVKSTEVKFVDSTYTMFIKFVSGNITTASTYCIDDGNGNYIKGNIEADNSIKGGTYTSDGKKCTSSTVVG